MYYIKMTEPHSLNDLAWIAGLDRTKANVRYSPVALHCYTKLRNAEGVAPVVLELENCCYIRVQANLEAAFELCLRHLNQLRSPWPVLKTMTIQNFLADRATEALKLPGCYIPTMTGEIQKLTEPVPLLEVLPVDESTDLVAMPLSQVIVVQNVEEALSEGCCSDVGAPDVAFGIDADEPQPDLTSPIADPVALPLAPTEKNVVSRPTSKKERRKESQLARRARR